MLHRTLHHSPRLSVVLPAQLLQSEKPALRSRFSLKLYTQPRLTPESNIHSAVRYFGGGREFTI
jgi:hypothetical protein